ncbi:hypothetical protein ACFL2Q_05340 [Thermodesulfobacteriota bacterium]
MKELVKIRNDFAHSRIDRTESSIREYTEKLTDLLSNVMTELSFLVDYSVFLIREVYRRPGENRTRVKTLGYYGERPKSLEFEIEDEIGRMLAKDGLYVRSEGQWIQLYPYLTVFECKDCNEHETYFIDKWGGDSSLVVLRSLDKGHEQRPAGVAAYLESLIPRPQKVVLLPIPGRRDDM